VAEERVGREGHGLACVRDDELRHGLGEFALDDQRRSAGGDGLRREVVTVGAVSGDADEKGPGGHTPCVVRQIGDLDGGRVCGAGGADRLGQKLELDGSGFYQRASLALEGRRAGFPLFCTHIVTVRAPLTRISAIG